MNRIGQFLTHQIAAWRALFARAAPEKSAPVEVVAEKTAPQRPSAMRLV
jgi:hypothetical protein